MRKILLTLMLIFSVITGYTQSTPRFLLNDKGDTIGVLISVSQAQKIDNDYELLSLYKGIHSDCDSTVSFLIKVVDDYKRLNVIAEARFKADSVIIFDNKSQIDNLKSQIDIKSKIISIKDSIIGDKNGIIDISKLEIKKYKKQRNRAIEIGSSVSLFLFWLIIGHPGIK